jgi:uncharacterized membrane protein
MSGKNQVPLVANWQSVSPVIGFLPLNANTQGKGSIPSGVLTGTMSGTNTIYSNIFDVSRMDDLYLEVAWTGSSVGVFSILASVSGVNFNTLTFGAVPLAQPIGVDGGYGVNIALQGFKYILLQYVNASGVGVLTVNLQEKDLN